MNSINKFIIDSMQQIGQSESVVFNVDQQQQNEFLLEFLQYECCPFCNRSFFRGKLAYHLKHCSSTNPMTKTHKNSPREMKSNQSAMPMYERCGNCNCRMPSFLIEKHRENCSKISEIKTKKTNETKDTVKDHVITTQESVFPKIKNYSSQDHAKTTRREIFKTNTSNVIKIRDELRCFRIAEQIQKIECEHCGRRFSKQASERHIPICCLLKQKEKRCPGTTRPLRNKSPKQPHSTVHQNEGPPMGPSCELPFP